MYFQCFSGGGCVRCNNRYHVAKNHIKRVDFIPLDSCDILLPHQSGQENIEMGRHVIPAVLRSLCPKSEWGALMEEKLNPEQLLYAYSNGYFAMAHEEEDGQIYWHRPAMRGVIPLDKFHVSKNLKRLWRNHTYDLRIDTAFSEVVKACAKRSTTWINDEILDAYTQLHEMNYAKSFEVWSGDDLVGGLYGVDLGRAFFGESMFSRETNTSKLALLFLVEYLRENDYLLLDTQYLNNHIKQFGAIEISDEKYMDILSQAISKDV